jgi:transcriptional regulator with GAF, ATPase, and Fis domain
MLFESLQRVVVELGREPSLPVLLDRVVGEIGAYPDVALAGIWIRGPVEQCAICRDNPDSAQPGTSLHVAACAGSLLTNEEKRDRVLHLCHFGGRAIRQVNDQGTALFIKELDEKNSYEWVRDANIRSFAGHPLMVGGEMVGVLSVCIRRVTMTRREFEWMRIFAVAIAHSIVRGRALDEADRLRRRLESTTGFPNPPAAANTSILGSSPGIRRVLEQIEMVAATDVTVLILGETGVGKELVARAIHDGGPRRSGALVNVNCTAIPHELFESIFFGHVLGSFSGATTNRNGRFQLADHGSLFLDEVGDMPTHMQPKLLRVLQDGKFEPVGSEKTLHADVRVIAASNRDLKEAIGEGRFREDLYYRISVFPIEVPPLRARKDDIPILSGHFVDAACHRFGRQALQLTTGHIRQLQDYDWPGNVRELQNVIERAVLTSRRGALQLDLGHGDEKRAAAPAQAFERLASEATGILTDEEMKRRERDNVNAALRRSEGRIYGPGGAAELLGMKPTTLNARIKKWRLDKLS